MSSLPAIRDALEDRLATITPVITIAHENVSFVPTAGAPYMEPFLLPASPDNIEIGPGFADQGIFAVNLFFSKGTGPLAATAHAELIRAAFPFGASFVNSGVTTNIVRTPEIAPARPDGDRFMVPVKIRWRAWVSG
jgi:hypothetical protein